MTNKDGKSDSRPDKNSRALRLAIMIFVLCGFSFYLGAIFGSVKDRYLTRDIAKAFEASKETDAGPPSVKAVNFSECTLDLQDYTPCTDPRRWNKYSRHRLSFLERHCPPVFKRKECLIPPPAGYKLPIRWPKSRDECWYRNVPYDWINRNKSDQHWLRKEGEKFIFPGGGTMFPNGVAQYVDLMQDLIPEMKDGMIRTAIDTGCGVASWGGDLLDRGILTVSLAPRDNHEAQVQFALERGIPAMLGIISTQRLPFPSNSFDMAHCSRCLIPWNEYGGIYLLEIHRILRPGGFWVLSGPPINYQRHWRGWNTALDQQKSDYEKLQKHLTSMCFKLHNNRGDIAIWQKLPDPTCYTKLDSPDNYPSSCDDSTGPDSAWYIPMRSCIVEPSPKSKRLELRSLAKWPERLKVPPERLGGLRGVKAFGREDKKWEKRVREYVKWVPAIGMGEIRNVMDMNTVWGGFAAALIGYPLWVMNVVSPYAPNTLAVVFDRGLIGTYHDWCEAFSTYPRTYDLLHLDGLFSAESHRCEMKYVMLEMDRILRPKGYVIIRESSYFMNDISTMAKGMRWGCLKENTENGVEHEQILICQKKLWFAKQNSTR